MAKTSLIVTSQNLDEGTSQQFTITDVNPNATDAELKTFAQMAVGLTEDTYVKTDRVDKRTLDNLPERVFNNIQYNVTNTNTYTDAPADGVINLTTADCIKNGNSYRFQLRFSGSLALCFPQVTATSSIGMTLRGHTATYYYKGGLGGSDIWNIMFTTNSDPEYVIQPQVITFKVTFPAYGGYASWSKTFTFNITAPEEG